jgi:hypothetical protein
VEYFVVFLDLKLQTFVDGPKTILKHFPVPNNHRLSQHRELLCILINIIVFFDDRVNFVDYFVDSGELLVYTDDGGGELLPEEAVDAEDVLVLVGVCFRVEVLVALNHFGDEVAVDAEDVAYSVNDMDQKRCGFILG